MCINLHTGQAWLTLYRDYTHLTVAREILSDEGVNLCNLTSNL